VNEWGGGAEQGNRWKIKHTGGWKGLEECMDGEVLRRENVDDESRAGSA